MSFFNACTFWSICINSFYVSILLKCNFPYVCFLCITNTYAWLKKLNTQVCVPIFSFIFLFRSSDLIFVEADLKYLFIFSVVSIVGIVIIIIIITIIVKASIFKYYKLFPVTYVILSVIHLRNFSGNIDKIMNSKKKKFTFSV